MHEKVARLRRLLAEAVPEHPAPSAAGELVLDQSPRARAEREIARIVAWYHWDVELMRLLDVEGAASVSLASTEAVDRILARMKKLEDCFHEGHQPPESAAAF